MSGEDSSLTKRCTLFSWVMVYIVGHIVGIQKVKRTIHMPTILTIINVVTSLSYKFL